MASKFLITEGFSMNPGTVDYIVVHGLETLDLGEPPEGGHEGEGWETHLRKRRLWWETPSHVSF